jgi:hypothetical protein
MLYASDMLAPIELLGPIANYIFLRYVRGDKETEAHQTRRYSASNPEKFKDFESYRKERNSIWPDAQLVRLTNDNACMAYTNGDEILNKWTWVVVGCGAVGVALEAAVDSLV